MHIAIAGNIGAGKTTLTNLLSRYFNFEALYEENEDNPYLLDFYSDMQRWSFHLQISFLHSRLKKVIQIQQEQRDVIQDRTIYEDAQIFAPNLHSMGLLSTRDYTNYKDLFELIAGLIQPPDLLIYLRSSIPTLVEQIQDRGRAFEDSLRLDYLKSLNERYEAWYESYDIGKKMEIDVGKVNFRDNPEDLGIIINRVKGLMFGLFSE
ncbi:MAG: deoxynucleoside kinase [Bacteroidota bacterium]